MKEGLFEALPNELEELLLLLWRSTGFSVAPVGSFRDGLLRDVYAVEAQISVWMVVRRELVVPWQLF